VTAALSVVVCTHGRPADLERCLEALARLEDPVEVIVVDSASALPVGPVLERFPGVRSLYEPEPGLSRARNRGIAEASGEVVAFVDDDAAPAPDWARRLLAGFDRDERVGCVGGTCRARFEAPRPRWLSERLLQLAGITRIGDEPREARSSSEWPFGANVAFRAEALRATGGFAEDLGRIGGSLLSGEETALIETLRGLGWRIRLEPAAVVDHTVQAERCTARWYWRRLWWAGVTRARSDRSVARGLKLLAAVPVRSLLYLATRDRIYLYRLAETAGFLRAALARS
jgi:glucosyl-dolichyl phosphate glucuronosyltransferase